MNIDCEAVAEKLAGCLKASNRDIDRGPQVKAPLAFLTKMEGVRKCPPSKAPQQIGEHDVF